ncbi:trypsin-7-like [Phymastichus coffea]|uniref:trypsin-7-like n=1 Tax=Phymastichus coffea TaxID=108790 RepID=UPI00273C6D22|nr:trypsin-7-like [Phymastichus coffea]
MSRMRLSFCHNHNRTWYIDKNGYRKNVRTVKGGFVNIEEESYKTDTWYTSVNKCGATVIDKWWVLTTVHCLKNKTNILIRTSGTYKAIMGTTRKIEKVIIHPHYNTDTYDNDIALMKLQEPIKINNKQKPIPIANSSDLPTEGQQMFISGFRDDISSLPYWLKFAIVLVMNQENCKNANNNNPISDNLFCASSDDINACQADFEGPAIINNKLYGIISSGATYRDLDRKHIIIAAATWSGDSKIWYKNYSDDNTAVFHDLTPVLHVNVVHDQHLTAGATITM